MNTTENATRNPGQRATESRCGSPNGACRDSQIPAERCVPLDSAEAAAWLGSQPESDGKADAMGHVMWDWTNADPESAAAWLGEQEPGPSYDNGVAGLAKAATHVYQDGETGISWATTIENEQLRGRMVDHTLGQWMRQDPEAARAWATENDVPVPRGRSGGK